MKQLDPTGLVITRKRKKWKFANFDSFENCFSHLRGSDAKTTLKKVKKYLPSQPLVLELAAGNAQFSLELARRHPKLNFIAVDIKSDRLYQGAKCALEEGITNIAFLRTHMNELASIFGKKSITEIWLTFPDPFPRKRSSKHRLTHSHFLKIYAQILKKNGWLKFKTDNRNLFLWSLEQFVAEGWQFNELSFDLHESDLTADYKIKTYYEQRYMKEGASINFVSLMKK